MTLNRLRSQLEIFKEDIFEKHPRGCHIKVDDLIRYFRENNSKIPGFSTLLSEIFKIMEDDKKGVSTTEANDTTELDNTKTEDNKGMQITTYLIKDFYGHKKRAP